MNYWLQISYDGTDYYGYGTQPHQQTIQDKLEKTLSSFFNELIKTTAASRTDRFVHAKDQNLTFTATKEYETEDLVYKLNRLLPDDIRVITCYTGEFTKHVRHSVKEKTYSYKIMTEYDLFQRYYKFYLPYKLNVDAMQKAAKALIGTHSFKSFCSKNANTTSFVRTIYSIEITEIENDIVFTFCGNGFLYNMIRIIVGTLIEVGKGKIKYSKIEEILEQENRQLAKATAPAHGLCLEKIKY